MPRRFSRGQKVDLYVAADGLCSICGKVLEVGWHGDHVVPFSAGGLTSLGNGQALCARCNIQKGNRMIAKYTDTVEYRPWQLSFREAGIQKMDLMESGGPAAVLVGNISPGSGKTRAGLDLANEAYRRGLIDAVAVFVPRKNLAEQYEFDWEDICKLYDPAKRMGKVVARGNVSPLRKDSSQFGYVSTYSALISKPDLHKKFFRDHRTMVIFDEAQQLGVEEDGGTESAIIAQELGHMSRIAVIKSGTCTRADGRPLIFARYSAPDENGMRYLLADVSATYLEGVSQKYLRPFEAHLCEAQAFREYLDGVKIKITTASVNSGLSDILESPGFWKPMVDRTIEKVREVQGIHPGHCGLIAARRQQHARSIKAYLDAKGIRSSIAVSDDGDEAKDNLKNFKAGGNDILITVAMAHVGYDHKPITVVCCLNAVREFGWLDQLIARGMRMWDEVPVDSQICTLIAPNDRQMVAYADAKRRESEQGIKERKSRESSGVEPGDIPLSFLSDVSMTGVMAMGMEPENDLDTSSFMEVDSKRKSYSLGPCSVSNLGRLLRDHGVLSGGTAVADPVEKPKVRQTLEQEEGEERTKISKIASKIDMRLMAMSTSASHGDAYSEVYDRFYHGARPSSYKNSKLIETFSLSELQSIRSWMTNDYFPAVDKRWRDCGSPKRR